MKIFMIFRNIPLLTVSFTFMTQVIILREKIPLTNLQVRRKVVYFVIEESPYPFFPAPINESLIFDLKGSWIRRTTKVINSSFQSDTSSSSTSTRSQDIENTEKQIPHKEFPPFGKVLMDNNLIDILLREPNWLDFNVSGKGHFLFKSEQMEWEEFIKRPELTTSKIVMADLLKDAYFLAKCGCMNYSLMLVIIPFSPSILDTYTNQNGVHAAPLPVLVDGKPHLASVRIVNTSCRWTFEKCIKRYYDVFVRRMPKKGLDYIPPDWYAKRFVDMCEKIFLG